MPWNACPWSQQVENVALLDQCFDMTELYVEGPVVMRLLSHVGRNCSANYGKNKGKQLICVNHDGKRIGGMVLFGLEDNKVNIVGPAPGRKLSAMLHAGRRL